MSEAGRLRGKSSRSPARLTRPADGTVACSAKPGNWPPSPSFAELYESHHRSLFRLAALLTGDSGIAEAAVLDAFATLHSTWKAVGSTESAWRYLLRLVILRSRRAVRRSRFAAAGSPAEATLRSPSCPAAGGVAALPDQPALMLALRSVPLHQREAVVLTCYLDLTEGQAAAAMGMRKAAVRRLVAEGRTVLEPVLPANR
jgi:DNA-directed RNA polymerase specialized sigma24 family protein